MRHVTLHVSYRVNSTRDGEYSLGHSVVRMPEPRGDNLDAATQWARDLSGILLHVAEVPFYPASVIVTSIFQMGEAYDRD